VGLASFVMAAVAVRFVFPAVSAEGPAFWIIRTAPVSLRHFLWSKFWTGLLPIVILAEGLTIAANEFLGSEPFLKVVTAMAVVLMSVALVGLATGMGARYPRFSAESMTQVAASYGGIVFMILAVLFIVVMTVLLAWPSSIYLWHQFRGVPVSGLQRLWMAVGFLAAAALSLATFWFPMQAGVRALEAMDRTPT
jgi:ABC-2 type transport system permease protein